MAAFMNVRTHPKVTRYCYKHHYFRRAQRSNSLADWNSYKQVRNMVKSEVNASYWRYVNDLFALPDNRKRFFAYVRSLKRNPPPSVLTSDEHVINQPSDIAQQFGSFFQSVFSTLADALPSVPATYKLPIPSLGKIHISHSEVFRQVSNLNERKSPGPDGLTPTLLKKSAKVVAPVLQRIFTLSLSRGILPTLWKHAHITPVFKSGDRSLTSNYRPVALTSIVSKIMETIIANTIRSHLDDNCLLSPVQHGFTKGKSCVTQLLSITNDWLT